MTGRLFRIAVAILMVSAFVYMTIWLAGVEIVFHEEIVDYVAIARTMNIRNLVSVIYLGPRIFDTMIEVLVVVLTVYGMTFLRGNE
ncbi:MAG: hypothetical protein EA403_14060 [Spirochaetaceae bacterium]|nr:MAG: hypothetical protein EA403_14060 [Spirochaetaceae bacterium]